MLTRHWAELYNVFVLGEIIRIISNKFALPKWFIILKADARLSLLISLLTRTKTQSAVTAYSLIENRQVNKISLHTV